MPSNNTQGTATGTASSGLGGLLRQSDHDSTPGSGASAILRSRRFLRAHFVSRYPGAGRAGSIVAVVAQRRGLSGRRLGPEQLPPRGPLLGHDVSLA